MGMGVLRAVENLHDRPFLAAAEQKPLWEELHALRAPFEKRNQKIRDGRKRQLETGVLRADVKPKRPKIASPIASPPHGHTAPEQADVNSVHTPVLEPAAEITSVPASLPSDPPIPEMPPAPVDAIAPVRSLLPEGEKTLCHEEAPRYQEASSVPANTNPLQGGSDDEQEDAQPGGPQRQRSRVPMAERMRSHGWGRAVGFDRSF
jgi:hypothetical protein